MKNSGENICLTVRVWKMLGRSVLLGLGFLFRRAPGFFSVPVIVYLGKSRNSERLFSICRPVSGLIFDNYLQIPIAEVKKNRDLCPSIMVIEYISSYFSISYGA